MTVQIKETGKIESLRLVDPKSGCDWSPDFVDAGSLPRNDDGDTVMSQDDYDWWVDQIDKYQEQDDAWYALRSQVADDEFEEIEKEWTDLFNTDVESYPSVDALVELLSEHNYAVTKYSDGSYGAEKK